MTGAATAGVSHLGRCVGVSVLLLIKLLMFGCWLPMAKFGDEMSETDADRGDGRNATSCGVTGGSSPALGVLLALFLPLIVAKMSISGRHCRSL